MQCIRARHDTNHCEKFTCRAETVQHYASLCGRGAFEHSALASLYNATFRGILGLPLSSLPFSPLPFLSRVHPFVLPLAHSQTSFSTSAVKTGLL